MVKTGRDVEQAAVQTLQNCLAEVPFIGEVRVQREVYLEGAKLDFIMEVDLPEGKQVIIGEAKYSGQPRLAREAAYQLLKHTRSIPGSYGVFVAPYISPEAASVCLRDGLGYADLAGNCYLSFGRVFIRKECHTNPFAVRQELRTLYSPKAERVLRVLLAGPNNRWKTQALAGKAGVSLGHVAKVKAALRDREWIRVDPEGFYLSNPEALLTEWAEQNNLHRNRAQDFYAMKDVPEIESRLADICKEAGVQYALTAFSGAARFAPFVRYQRVYAYIEGPLDELVASLGLKPVTSGANVSLILPHDEGVLYGATEVDRVRVASPIQLYLDLRALRARGEDAAEFLLKEVIRPRW